MIQVKDLGGFWMPTSISATIKYIVHRFHRVIEVMHNYLMYANLVFNAIKYHKMPESSKWGLLFTICFISFLVDYWACHKWHWFAYHIFSRPRTRAKAELAPRKVARTQRRAVRRRTRWEAVALGGMSPFNGGGTFETDRLMGSQWDLDGSSLVFSCYGEYDC